MTDAKKGCGLGSYLCGKLAHGQTIRVGRPQISVRPQKRRAGIFLTA
jgi:hypothetical protein